MEQSVGTHLLLIKIFLIVNRIMENYFTVDKDISVKLSVLENI